MKVFPLWLFLSKLHIICMCNVTLYNLFLCLKCSSSQIKIFVTFTIYFVVQRLLLLKASSNICYDKIIFLQEQYPGTSKKSKVIPITGSNANNDRILPSVTHVPGHLPVRLQNEWYSYEWLFLLYNSKWTSVFLIALSRP